MNRKIIYNEFERRTLQNLIDKYRNIIDNKCTKSENVFRKQQTWIRITSEYNSVQNTRKRLTKQLKRLYENLKARTKKKIDSNLNTYTNNNNDTTDKTDCLYNSSESIMDESSTTNAIINNNLNHISNTDNSSFQNFGENGEPIFIEPNNYIVVDDGGGGGGGKDHNDNPQLGVPTNTKNNNNNSNYSQHEIPSSLSKPLLYSNRKNTRRQSIVQVETTTMTTEDVKGGELQGKGNEIDFSATINVPSLINNNEIVYQQSEDTLINYDKFLTPLVSMKMKKIEESIEQQRNCHQLQMKREQLQIQLFEIQLNNENNLHSHLLRQQNELHALRIKHEQAIQEQRLRFEQELHESKLNEYHRIQNVTSSSSSSSTSAAYPLMYK